MNQKHYTQKNTSNNHISEFEKFCTGINKIKERIQYKTLGEEVTQDNIESEYNLVIDDIESLEDCIKTQMNGNLAAIINTAHSSLFLECCLHSVGLEGIEYLIKRGAEINYTNLLGLNALHMIILNKLMGQENKEKAVKILIEKGIDINRPNLQCETPLMLALKQIEFGVANILINNNAYILRLPSCTTNETNSEEK